MVPSAAASPATLMHVGVVDAVAADERAVPAGSASCLQEQAGLRGVTTVEDTRRAAGLDLGDDGGEVGLLAPWTLSVADDRGAEDLLDLVGQAGAVRGLVVDDEDLRRPSSRS